MVSSEFPATWATDTFRSHMLAWESRGIRTLSIIGGIFICYGLLLGPSGWHTGASMDLVHRLGLPWTVWGALFALYSALLVHHMTRTLGYFFGFVLYAFYAGSFVVASAQGHLASVVLLVVSILATIQQALWAVKTMIEEARRTWIPPR